MEQLSSQNIDMTGEDDDTIVECEEEGTSCVICNEALDEELHLPVALPACGHTFCKPCLVNLQHRSQVLLCPTCRQPHGGEDVAHLPPNYLVLSLIPCSSQVSEVASGTDGEKASFAHLHILAAMYNAPNPELSNKQPGPTDLSMCYKNKGGRSPWSENFEGNGSRVKENFDDGHSNEKRHHHQLQEEVDLEPTKKDLKENESHVKRTDTDIENNKNMTKDYDYVCMRQDTPEERQGDGPTAAVGHQKHGDEVVNFAWYKEKKLMLLLVGLIIVALAVGAGISLGCAPSFLNQMGFTHKGVVGESYASKLMSSTSRSNNGTIPRESWVAWLQNAGHKGFTPRSQAVLGVLGALTVAVLFGVPISCCLVTYWQRRQRSRYLVSGDGIPLTGPKTTEELHFSQ